MSEQVLEKKQEEARQVSQNVLDKLVIPDGTKFEERTIVAASDIIVGDHANVGYGLIGRSIICGEHVAVNGDIRAEDDLRVDTWSEIKGDVFVGKNAYFAEFTHIFGKLFVAGDLDIGNEVKVDAGFEAKGWIVIRNPVPVIFFILIYILTMLRLGKSEEVEKMLDALEDEEEELKIINAMTIPQGAQIMNETIKSPRAVRIGSMCRILGNVRATSARVGESTTIFGSLRAKGNISVGRNTIVHGDVISRGNVFVEASAHVLGQVFGRKIRIHESALVDGALNAENGVTILRGEY